MIWNENFFVALKRGSREAQKQCYIELSPNIYTTILKICGNKDIANELLHDTFIDMFTKINSYNESYLFIAWAKRIAINNTINFEKRKASARKIIQLMPNSDDNSYSYSNDNLLEKLLSMLKLEHRAIIWLYIVEQYTHNEIGELLNKSESYSKSVVSRSLAMLRKNAKELIE